MDDFGGRARGTTAESIETRIQETLSRARPKALAKDYLELSTGFNADVVSRLVLAEWEKEEISGVPHAGSAISRARKPQSMPANKPPPSAGWPDNNPRGQAGRPTVQLPVAPATPSCKIEKDLELGRNGPEEDLEL